MSEDMRFDLSARVEVWVTAEEIRWHSGFAAASRIEDEKARHAALRQIAVDIASKRIASRSDGQLDITADVSLSAVNIDRIHWDEFKPVTPDVHARPLGLPRTD